MASALETWTFLRVLFWCSGVMPNHATVDENIRSKVSRVAGCRLGRIRQQGNGLH
jgi:hypothetical protein